MPSSFCCVRVRVGAPSHSSVTTYEVGAVVVITAGAAAPSAAAAVAAAVEGAALAGCVVAPAEGAEAGAAEPAANCFLRASTASIGV